MKKRVHVLTLKGDDIVSRTFRDYFFGKAVITDCPKCGTEVPYGDDYCPTCGHRITEAEPKLWDCEKCGNKAINSGFCPDCGAKRPEAEKPWSCKCGESDLESPFCPKCGSPKPEKAEVKPEPEKTEVKPKPYWHCGDSTCKGSKESFPTGVFKACPFCGKTPPPPTHSPCKKCGKDLHSSWKVCPYCGEKQ